MLSLSTQSSALPLCPAQNVGVKIAVRRIVSRRGKLYFMSTPEATSDDFANRHRFSSRLVFASIVLTLILVVLSIAGVYPAAGFFDQTLYVAFRIAILFCGLGAVVVRRTRFNSTRLIDTAAVKGPSGLLASMQKTIVIVTTLAVAMAVLGYVITATQTGQALDTLLPGLASLAILIFTYPRRAAWQRILQTIKDWDASPATKGSAS